MCNVQLSLWYPCFVENKLEERHEKDETARSVASRGELLFSIISKNNMKFQCYYPFFEISIFFPSTLSHTATCFHLIDPGQPCEIASTSTCTQEHNRYTQNIPSLLYSAVMAHVNGKTSHGAANGRTLNGTTSHSSSDGSSNGFAGRTDLASEALDTLEPMKYIVVTGGVVSGLGKGVTISSIGRMLKNCGLRTTSIKIDPYLVRVGMCKPAGCSFSI